MLDFKNMLEDTVNRLINLNFKDAKVNKTKSGLAINKGSKTLFINLRQNSVKSLKLQNSKSNNVKYIDVASHDVRRYEGLKTEFKKFFK